MSKAALAGNVAAFIAFALAWLVAACLDILLLTVVVWAVGHYILGVW